MALFDSIYLVTLAGWIGSALFLWSGVIPLFFEQLEEAQAEKLLRALLARYSLWGAICGALALSSMVAVPLCYPEFRGRRVGVQAMAIISCIAITLYVGNSLTSKPNAGGAGPARHGWHLPAYGRASFLGAVVAVTGLVLLVAFATRTAPKTSGIVELTPTERARYDAAISRVIEQIEIKYGFRQPSPRKSAEPIAAEPVIDAETVKEIESYYAEKRRKEDARRGSSGALNPARRTTGPADLPRPSG